MPIFNSRGDVLAGWGTAPITINGFGVDTGGRGGWLSDDEAIYTRCPAAGCEVVVFDKRTNNIRQHWPFGANFLNAGGSVAAAWNNHGLYNTHGTQLPLAGPGIVSPDGAIAYCPNAQSGYTWVVQENFRARRKKEPRGTTKSGELWTLTDGYIDDSTYGHQLHLLGAKRAVWTQAQVLYSVGLPACVTVGPVGRPRAAELDGVWWLCYYTAAHGIVLHPFDSTLGYVLTTGDAFCHDIVAVGNRLLVTWSRGAGELPGDIVVFDVDLTLPRQDLGAVHPPIPPIDPPDPPEPGLEPPTGTITSYEPAEGVEPLNVKAYGKWTGGGPATEIGWLLRRHGSYDWARTEDDWDHTYPNLTAGVWEIALRVSNAAGFDQTGTPRYISVLHAPDPPDPPDPPNPEPEPPPMGLPDYDTFVNHESPEVGATYKSVNPDPSVPTTQQMGHTAWRRLVEAWTHRDILHDIKGEPLEDGGAGGAQKPPPTTTPPPVTTTPGDIGPLHKAGRQIQTASGERFLWRGATSFRLLHMIACGEEPQAIERMQQLAVMGYNVVRVLATAKHLFNLPMDVGRGSLRRLFDLALQHKLYVEIVALADTDDWPKSQLEAQLYEVYAKAAEYPNVLVEGGNELGPCHETQSEESVDVCRNFVPGGAALYCSGSVHGGGLCQEQDALTEEQWRVGNEEGIWPYWDEVFTYSLDFGTSHLKRDGSDADRGRRVRELEASSGNAKCLFVDDEPLGADETLQPGKRSNEPGVFYLQGVLSRIFEVGSCFHSQAGLTSSPFGPVQQGCAEAFINGSRIVADGVQLLYKNAGWHDAPIKEFTGACRIYQGIGADNIACVIAPESGLSIVYQNGWRENGVRADVTGCRVLNLVQG